MATKKYADSRMQAHVDRAFAYAPPQGDQAERYAAIGAPPSAELTLALRDLESGRMRVNQAIAINEPRQEV